MNLGIFLSPGESFELMRKVGQDVRFVEVYLKRYLKDFDQVYVFSYLNENYDLPKNIILVKNPTKLHRLVYAFLLPILQKDYVQKCDVVRGFGLASGLSSLILTKPFILNWAYDYYRFVWSDQKYIYLVWYFLLEKLVFLRANKILIATKKKLSHTNGLKFIYLPNGVDLKTFHGSTHRQGLIFIGRLEPQKNLIFLIDSLSLLPSSLKRITLVGSGSLKDELIEYAKVKKVKLKLIDKIPNDQIPKLLSEHSIFLLPSLNEGIPKVLQEAMACGLVPVLTKFPTSSEVVRDGVNGYIVNFDQRQYSKKILTLLSDQKLWQRMSQKAQLKIKTEFDQSKLLEKEIEVLKSVV